MAIKFRTRKFVPRERVVEAILFNGKNSKEIAAWVNKDRPTHTTPPKATARGNHVVLTKEDGSKITVRKGEWLGLDDLVWTVITADQMRIFYQPKKPPISEKRARATLEYDTTIG